MIEKLNRKKVLEFLVPGFISLVIMAGILSMLAVSGVLFSEDISERIETAARKSYVFRNYLQDDDISINCRDGVVTLSGTVTEASHSYLAAETVAGLPGVRKVDNQLRVREEIPEKESDTWIRMRVNNMIKLHRDLKMVKAGVEVVDGRVTLSGEAGSQAEKGLISAYVKDVEGVKRVTNEMTVAEVTKSKHRTFEEFIDDSSIKAQIKMALLFERGTSPFRADVSVKKGVVTVSGIAKNAAEKKLVSKRIEVIQGVKRIDNRMVVE